jgi:ribonuclease HII
MEQAVAGLCVAPAFVLVDGRDLPTLPCPGSAIVKGDAKSLSIAAASIVAKVARDGLMRRLAEEYPAYGFETNAGYGSPRHLAALAALGPTPCHRMSFSPLRRGQPPDSVAFMSDNQLVKKEFS